MIFHCHYYVRFVKAVANPGKVIISAPYIDAGGAGIVLTVSRNVAVKR